MNEIKVEKDQEFDLEFEIKVENEEILSGDLIFVKEEPVQPVAGSSKADIQRQDNIQMEEPSSVDETVAGSVSKKRRLEQNSSNDEVNTSCRTCCPCCPELKAALKEIKERLIKQDKILDYLKMNAEKSFMDRTIKEKIKSMLPCNDLDELRNFDINLMREDWKIAFESMLYDHYPLKYIISDELMQDVNFTGTCNKFPLKNCRFYKIWKSECFVFIY
ncbi:hypothetical protein DMENIID0001_084600 [Sergentomyia squamirostris]